MKEIIRAQVYAKVINVIPDSRENCVVRCCLKVDIEEVKIFRETSDEKDWWVFKNFKKGCYFLIGQENQELYQKILHLFPGDMITLEVFFDERHQSIVKDMIIEESTAVHDLWDYCNSLVKFDD